MVYIEILILLIINELVHTFAKRNQEKRNGSLCTGTVQYSKLRKLQNEITLVAVYVRHKQFSH